MSIGDGTKSRRSDSHDPRTFPAPHESVIGSGLSSAKPRKLKADLAQGADMPITTGSGDEGPYVPGLCRGDWPLFDPKGQGIETVRQTRDEIERGLLEQLTLVEPRSRQPP